MIGGANRVLREGRVVVAVGIGGGRTETLQIVFRDRVSVSAERRERQTRFHGFEGEGVDLDYVEQIFAALLAGEVIVDPCDERVAAELERMAAGIEAESFGKLAAMFASGTRKLIGTSNAVDDVGNLDQRVGGIGIGLAQVARELGAEMADNPRGQARDESNRASIGGNVFCAVVGDGVVGNGARGIKEYVVRSPVSGRVVAQGQLIAWREIDIELGIRCVPDLRSGIRSRK